MNTFTKYKMTISSLVQNFKEEIDIALEQSFQATWSTRQEVIINQLTDLLVVSETDRDLELFKVRRKLLDDLTTKPLG